jgi:hypothetical protein
MELTEWSKRAMVAALHDASQASTSSRRAFHEGKAAAFAFACDEGERGRNLLHMILVDYRGERETQGRAGYRHGAAMIRGVGDYLDALGEANTLAWARDAGAGVVEDEAAQGLGG